MCRRNGGCLAAVPPSAAQERRGSAPWEQSRRSRQYAPCMVCLLDPLLWPRRLCQAGRPPPAGLFVVQAEEHRLGGGGESGTWPCSSTRSPPPQPWPSSVLVRSGATAWPGPQRSTAAHDATMSAVVAACDAEQLLWKAAR